MASYQVCVVALVTLVVAAGVEAAPSAAAAAPASPWGAWWARWQTAECPGPGVFPDASDACSPAFRICVYTGPVRGLQPLPKSCPAGFVFNAATGCTFKRECFLKLYPQAAGRWPA